MNVDDVPLLLSEIEKHPEMVPPSVVRDMATALRILGVMNPTDSADNVLEEWFFFKNDAPTTLQDYIDRKNGNYL